MPVTSQSHYGASFTRPSSSVAFGKAPSVLSTSTDYRSLPYRLSTDIPKTQKAIVFKENKGP